MITFIVKQARPKRSKKEEEINPKNAVFLQIKSASLSFWNKCCLLFVSLALVPQVEAVVEEETFPGIGI